MMKSTTTLHKVAASMMSALILLQSVGMTPVYANLHKNPNEGTLKIDFTNSPVGIQKIDPVLTHDTIAGTIAAGNQSGTITLSPIEIPSLKGWKELAIQLAAGSEEDVSININACDGSKALASDLKLQQGKVDLSSLSASSRCIQPVITVAGSTAGKTPILMDNISLEWEPLSITRTQTKAPKEVYSCDSVRVDVPYAVSYVDDQDLYIRTTLETKGEAPTITMKGAAKSTESGVTTQEETKTLSNGDTITIPAHSAWWYFPTIKAGEASALSFAIDAPCGTTNRQTYTLTTHTDGEISDLHTSTPQVVKVTSKPTITIENDPSIESDGDYRITSFIRKNSNSSRYYPQFSPIAQYTFTVQPQKLYNHSWKEVENIDHYTATATVAELLTACPTAQIKDISDDGVFDAKAKTITWNQGAMKYSEKKTFSYGADMTTCANFTHMQEIKSDVTVTATSPSGQTATAKDTYSFVVLKDVKADFGITKTGPRRKNHDPDAYYKKPTHYTINLHNDGLLAVGDIVTTDRIPEKLRLNGPVTASYNGKLSTIWYHTSASKQEPTYTVSGGVLGGGRTQTYTKDARRIAIVTPCLGSTWFQKNGGICNDTTSSVSINVPVIYDTTKITDQCGIDAVKNTATAMFGSYAPIIKATELTKRDAPKKMTSMTSSIWGKLLPKPEVTMSTSSTITPGQEAEIILTAKNTSEEMMKDTVIELTKPANATISVKPGSGVDVNIQSEKIRFTLKDMPANTTKNITLSLIVPVGAENNETITLVAKMKGSDEVCGSVSDAETKTLTIHGVPNIKVNISRDLSLIQQKGSVEYLASLINIGNVATPSYMVGVIPDDMKLDLVKTAGKSKGGATLDCKRCKVYTAPLGTIGKLPQRLDPNDPFEMSDMAQYFSPATDNGDGTRTPASPDAKYIIIAFDGDRSVLDVGQMKKVTFLTTDTNHKKGDQIIMNVGAISRDLPQTIANEVVTHILDYPGAQVGLHATAKDVVESCEVNEIIVDYYADIGAENEKLIVTTSIPQELTITKVTNMWNEALVSEGATREPALLTTEDYTLTQTGDMNVYIFDATKKWNGTMSKLQGGKLIFTTDTPCDAKTNTTYEPTAHVYFENKTGKGQANDKVHILVQNADLKIIKNVNTYDPLPGEKLTYTLDISNPGLHDAENVTIWDRLPKGACYVADSTTVLTKGRSLAEPTVTPAECGADIQQTITWSVTGSNAITHQENGWVGYFPAVSDIVQVSYKITVADDAHPGDTVKNDAEVSTQNPEENSTNNTGSSVTTVPLPNLRVIANPDMTVDPGEDFSYTLTASNRSRVCAEDAYVVHLLPDVVPSADGQADYKITHISTNTGTIYYRNDIQLTDYTDTYPTFDPTNPTAGGRKPYTSDAVQPIQAIAVHYGSVTQTGTKLCIEDGNQTITIYGKAVNPKTDEYIPVGYTMPTRVQVANTAQETDYTDNTDTYAVTTPGVDLSVKIEGNPEGSYPGTTPGANQSYTLNFANSGTQPVCDVAVSLTIPEGITSAILPPTFDTTLSQKATDTTGKPLSKTISVQTMQDGSTYTFLMGKNRCLDPKTTGSISFDFLIADDVKDSTQITTKTHIKTLSDSKETLMTNNDDQTSVYVYRADATITKKGYASPTTSLTGNQTLASAGDIITYKLNYNNIGNANAEKTTISDTLPEGVCLDPDDLQSHLSAGATVEYFDSEGNAVTPKPTSPVTPTSNVIPAKAGISTDCAIRSFTIHLGTLTAPANAVGEGAGTFSGTLTGLVDEQGLQLYKKPQERSWMQSINSMRITDLVSGDFDGDGDIDLIGNAPLPNTNVTSLCLLVNDGKGNFTSTELKNANESVRSEVVVSGDFDGDGDIDIAGGAGEKFIFINDGEGNFTYTKLKYEGERLNDEVLVSGDFDGDGDIDLIGGWEYGGSSSVFINDGKGNFTYYKLKGIRTDDVISGDFDGDGDIDLIGKTIRGFPHFYIRTNNSGPEKEGLYTSTITAGSGFTARDKMITDVAIPEGSNITVSIYSDDTYTGEALIGPVSLASSPRIDIGNIPSTQKKLYIKYDFSLGTATESPVLRSYRASYHSTVSPSIIYRTALIDDTQKLAVLDTLTNTATISTRTPEITLENNDTSKTHQLAKADLEVTKRVSNTSGQPGDTITYTIDYTNHGPREAHDVVLVDRIPAGLVDVTMTPDMMLDGGLYRLALDTLPAYATGSVTITATIADTVTQGQTITNTTKINTSDIEADYTNNYDTATTIIGDFANLYTTIDCPPVGSLGGEVQCQVTRGNDGNTPVTDGKLEIRLPADITADPATAWTGLDISCTTDDTALPHKLICEGDDIAKLSAGAKRTAPLTLRITENYDLLEDTAKQKPATTLPVSSHIMTKQAEVTTNDNHSYDDLIVLLQQSSSIAGRTYADIDDSHTYTPADEVFGGVEVCADGTDVRGTKIHKCTTSNDKGEYLITRLLPGDYTVSWNLPEGYTEGYSTAGTIERATSRETVGKGSLQDESITDTQITTITIAQGDHGVNYDFATRFVACPEPIVWSVGAYPAETTDDSITITGSVTSLNTKFAVNGTYTKVSNDTFEVPFALQNGQNILKLSVFNKYAVCKQEKLITITKKQKTYTKEYTAKGSQDFVKKCDDISKGSTETYTVSITKSATATTPEEALAKAKTLAEQAVADDIKANGQKYADDQGTCTQVIFTGEYTAKGFKDFTSSICKAGETPKLERYTSTITKTAAADTQAKADQKAKELAEQAVIDDIQNNGQKNADTYGICEKKEVIIPPIPVLPHTGAEW